MANDSTITIDLSQPIELEFEMTTNGLHSDNKPIVRFMLIDSVDQISYLFPCSNKKKNKWMVKIPKTDFNTEHDFTFCMECIIDEYYFVPAEGTINFKNIPVINLDNAEEQVKEGAEAADITGQYAPTNGLLKPEYEPKRSSAKTPQLEPMDELIDIEELTNDIIPGSGKQYAQSDEKREMSARDIINKVLNHSKLKHIERKGKLFARDASGNVIVSGLETPAQKEAIRAINQKVKDIINPSK